MMQGTVKRVDAFRVWDSRGRPTIEAGIELHSGAKGRGIAPAGASTGSDEAIERRDGGSALGGLDVMRAIDGISQEIAPALIGQDVLDQHAFDNRLITLDGTPNKSRLGANSLIALSIAASHAAAAHKAVPLWRHYRSMIGGHDDVRLPLPEIQIFGGGAHAGARIDIQDLMVICPGAESFEQALIWTAEIYRNAGLIMAERGLLQGVADEGGYWPAFASNEEAVETLVMSIERAGYQSPDQVAIALDIAASEFYRGGVYRMSLDGLTLDTGQMRAKISAWLQNYPILSIEDPLSEHDHSGFADLFRDHGGTIQIVGDDLLVSDARKVRHAAANRLCNTVLLKPNQRGTLSELLDCWLAAKRAGMSGIISARSGESEDVTISHLAVGWDVPQLKVGSFARSERMAKWNEVLRIERSVGGHAQFTGPAGLTPGPVRDDGG